MPVTRRDVRFPSGGETLRGELTLPDGPARGSILLVHGFVSERREFMDLPERLAAKGWAALAFDRRGHGQSTGPRGRLTRAWSVADIAAAVRFLDAEPDAPRPYGALAHSLGTVWTSAAMRELPEIEAAVYGAPAGRLTDELRMPGEELMYRALGKASKAKERLGLGPLVVPYKIKYGSLYQDAKAVARAEGIGFLQGAVNLGDVDELLALDGAAEARHVRAPVLVVVAAHDRVVQNATSRRVYDALAGKKRWAELACGHSFWGDTLAEDAARLADEWFAEHLSRG